MKRLLTLSALLYSLTITTTSVAGEIVDTEWIGSMLVITYSPVEGYVECIVYNSSGAAIGSARDNALATVARILVMTPKKYAGKDLKITCKEIE